jgi:hypothetical protein
MPGYCIRLMIWSGAIAPWSVSSRRIALSAIDPAPWFPRIGVPLIFEMSTPLPDACWEMLPLSVCVRCPQRSDDTVGRRPLADRNASVASTRRSTTPAWMSRRPQP